MLIFDEKITESTARLARKCGFNEGCEYIWGEFDGYVGLHYLENCNKTNADCWFSAPTQSLLQRWLREEHGIQVYAYSSTKNIEEKYRDYVVYINGIAQNDARDEEYQTYEDAMELGLQNALKIIN